MISLNIFVVGLIFNNKQTFFGKFFIIKILTKTFVICFGWRRRRPLSTCERVPWTSYTGDRCLKTLWLACFRFNLVKTIAQTLFYVLYGTWWKLVHDTYKAERTLKLKQLAGGTLIGRMSHQEADTGGCSVTKVAGWCQKLATGAEVEKLPGIKDH